MRVIRLAVSSPADKLVSARDLAARSLKGLPEIDTPEQIDALARAIQMAIEDWFESIAFEPGNQLH
jgi:hypothetical protein